MKARGPIFICCIFFAALIYFTYSVLSHESQPIESGMDSLVRSDSELAEGSDIQYLIAAARACLRENNMKLRVSKEELAKNLIGDNSLNKNYMLYSNRLKQSQAGEFSDLLYNLRYEVSFNGKTIIVKELNSNKITEEPW